MANDKYKTVNWTAGQEVRAQDLNDSQKFLAAMLSDQIMSKLTIGDIETPHPHDASLIADGGGATGICHALTVVGGQPRRGSANNKIKITAGTVFARIAGGESGNERTFLPWTFDGTDELIIANGHATQYRWDLIQLKLELVSTDPQARVFANPPASALKDLATVDPQWTIEVSATIPGVDGNSIRVRAQPNPGVGVIIQEVGRDVTILYKSGVSTIQNVVDAIAAQATLIVVSDYSSGATVMTDPGDTFAYVSLAGGLDTVLVSSTVNMKRRVQGTLNVKQGSNFTVAGAYPTTADPGFVAIALILVPPTWAAAKPVSYWMEEQFAAAQVLPIMHDMRMPLNVRQYVVEADDMIGIDGSVWTGGNPGGDHVTRACNQNTSGGHTLIARCPTRVGRIVGITMLAGGGTATGTPPATGGAGQIVGLVRGGAVVVPFFEPGYVIDLAGADLSPGLWTATDATVVVKHADQEQIGKNPINFGPSIGFVSTVGWPIWCNGGRVCVDTVEPAHYSFRDFSGGGVAIGAGPYEHGIAVVFLCAVQAKVARVVFHVAEGL